MVFQPRPTATHFLGFPFRSSGALFDARSPARSYMVCTTYASTDSCVLSASNIPPLDRSFHAFKENRPSTHVEEPVQRKAISVFNQSGPMRTAVRRSLYFHVSSCVCLSTSNVVADCWADVIEVFPIRVYTWNATSFFWGPTFQFSFSVMMMSTKGCVIIRYSENIDTNFEIIPEALHYLTLIIRINLHFEVWRIV